MKKIICLWFVVCSVLYTQQNPFAFWHAAWEISQRNNNPLPANFTAQYDYENNKIILNATVFPDATSIEQMMVRGELSEFSTDENDGEYFLFIGEPADTTFIQNVFAEFGDYTDDQIWFVTLWVKEFNKPFYHLAKQDTIWIDQP